MIKTISDKEPALNIIFSEQEIQTMLLNKILTELIIINRNNQKPIASRWPFIHACILWAIFFAIVLN